jgi:hypothetical protein
MLRIKDWTVRYEVNRTRELKRMDWVPMPNSMDGDGYTELMNHKHGAAHLGAWLAIVQIASKCEPRGCLIRRCGAPHDNESLSRISRISAKVFAEAIPRLLKIKWLEEIEIKPIQSVKPYADSKRVTPEIPQEGAGFPHPDAEIPQEGAVLARARGTEEQGTEQNRTEQDKGEPVRITSHPEWKTDPSFQPFVAAYLRSGFPAIDDDFAAAYSWSWRLMDFEQRALALTGVKERIDKGAWTDPAFIPKPQNFLKSEYKRPVVVRGSPAVHDPIKIAKALAAERRQAREAQS